MDENALIHYGYLWRRQGHEPKNLGRLSTLRKTFRQLPTRKQEAHLYSHKKLSLAVHLNSLGSRPLTTTKTLYHRTYTLHLWWFFYISKLANKNKHIYLLYVCFSISKQNHILTLYIHLFYTRRFNQLWTKAIFKWHISQNWGDGSMGKMFIEEAWRPEFESPTPTENTGHGTTHL